MGKRESRFHQQVTKRRKREGKLEEVERKLNNSQHNKHKAKREEWRNRK